MRGTRYRDAAGTAIFNEYERLDPRFGKSAGYHARRRLVRTTGHNDPSPRLDSECSAKLSMSPESAKNLRWHESATPWAAQFTSLRRTTAAEIATRLLTRCGMPKGRD